MHSPRHHVVGRSERGIVSYLLLPRPGDLFKAAIIPIAFAVGCLISGEVDASKVLRALVVWIVIEPLLYQARYQFNDVRGFVADQRHPHAAQRGRLPGPASRGRTHIAFSLFVACGRIVVAAGITVACSSLQVAAVVIPAGICVYAVAAAYEWLRGRATGHSHDVPPKIRPSLVALWIVAGGGYAVRGMTGLVLGTDLHGDAGIWLASTLAMWALGVCFVTARWSLESMPFATVCQSRVRWAAKPEQAREHTLGLVRWLPATIDERDLFGGTDPAHWRALHPRTPLLAPWNLAAIVAGAAALVAGGSIAGATTVLGVVIAAAAGAVCAGVITQMSRHRAPAVVCAAALLAAAYLVLDSPRALPAASAWTAALAAYAFFTSRSLAMLGHPLRGLLSPRSARS
jgi:hypothetical protein